MKDRSDKKRTLLFANSVKRNSKFKEYKTKAVQFKMGKYTVCVFANVYKGTIRVTIGDKEMERGHPGHLTVSEEGVCFHKMTKDVCVLDKTDVLEGEK